MVEKKKNPCGNHIATGVTNIKCVYVIIFAATFCFLREILTTSERRTYLATSYS